MNDETEDVDNFRFICNIIYFNNNFSNILCT